MSFYTAQPLKIQFMENCRRGSFLRCTIVIYMINQCVMFLFTIIIRDWQISRSHRYKQDPDSDIINSLGDIIVSRS